MQELAWIVDDKLAHAQTGFGIGLFLAVALMIVWRGRFHERAVLVPFLAPLAIAAAAGVGKELIDPVADWNDFAATIWGGFVAAACLFPLNVAWIVVRRLGATGPSP